MQTRTWKAPEIAQRRPLPASDIRCAITPEEALAAVRCALANPEPKAIVDALPALDLRALTPEEIEELEARGCSATDWSGVLVDRAFSPRWLARAHFMGEVRIGRLEGEVELTSGLRAPAGVSDSTIANCTLHAGVHVSSVGLLSNVVVGEGAVISRTQEVTAGSNCAFANCREIAVGIETGGREVLSFAEITVAIAEAVAKRRDQTEFIAAYGELAEAYRDKVRLPHGFVGPGARIVGCGRVADTFLGPGARLERATAVENTMVLSSPEEPSRVGDGCMVRDSILQWGCEVDSMAIVMNSVLTEHSHVERHGKLSDSILGPNSGIAEGEATACLIGPFVAFHHQALLIAAIWPEGRGNIAYGANVGSNHTSRAPDQEIWPGEGVFFGLGCDIKYPANFSDAPYSIVASGVTMLPQRVTMPFSLVSPPARNVEAISPSFNEILPGWVLYSNFYALSRNEAKFQKRNRSRRSTFDFSVFRPETVAMMLNARAALLAVPKERHFYTDADIVGIGKNYLSDSARLLAIEAYSRHSIVFALRELLVLAETLVAAGRGVPADLLTAASDDERWEWARTLLTKERPALGLREALELLAHEQRALATGSQQSKERDDHRGSLTIPGFLDAHAPASEDSVVKRLWEETAALEGRVERVLAHI
jgi:hypothetical protein